MKASCQECHLVKAMVVTLYHLTHLMKDFIKDCHLVKAFCEDSHLTKTKDCHLAKAIRVTLSPDESLL